MERGEHLIYLFAIALLVLFAPTYLPKAIQCRIGWHSWVIGLKYKNRCSQHVVCQWCGRDNV